jgi:nitrous oxidase accessory protein
MRAYRLAWVILFLSAPCLLAAPIAGVAELTKAVREAPEGATITLAAGRFELTESLKLKDRMKLVGVGRDKTVITHTAGWKPATKTLPDPEMTRKNLDTSAYLIQLPDRSSGIEIAHLTLEGPAVHGAIFAWEPAKLHLHHLGIRNVQWSGVRTFAMKNAKIHDCHFENAGGRWQKGEPGVKGGITGGGLFAIWMADCEIYDNRFTRTQPAREREYYGIKVRQGKRCRIHHNTIEVNFSLEFPFENDEDVEIDHNVLHGTVSIPKHAGGPIPKSGRTFHIHHNWFRDTYAIEFVRNGVEIDHNLFDFDPAKDHGNLISGFGNATAKGPAVFHNNLVSNPGRGVIWINEVFNHLEVRNNHIITRKTKTPRTEGLFGLNPKTDFKTITLRDNRIECEAVARPLLRAKESYESRIENNELRNVADAAKLKNPKAERPVGLEKPLQFRCGVKGETTIDGWKATPTETRKESDTSQKAGR